MKKENKRRLIFWGIVCGIFLIISISGFALYMTGHGVKGEIRKNLTPIVETFNKLKGLDQYKKININILANIEDNKVVVTYMTASSTSSFNFMYETMSTEKILHLSYSANDENIASIVTKNMIEAVSVVNGKTEGAVFEKHTLNDFTTTTILNGVAIKKDAQTNTTDVYINISKSVLDNEDLVIPDGNEASPENQAFYNMMSTLITHAKDDFMNNNSNTEIVYSNGDSCNSPLPNEEGIIYTIKLDNLGNVVEAYITDSLLQYYYVGDGLDINSVDAKNDIVLYDSAMSTQYIINCAVNQ